MDRLPTEIQSWILGLLPITTLVLCKAVSPSWRSIITSAAFINSYRPSRDPIFLVFSKKYHTATASGYLPSVGRWINFNFPANVPMDPRSTGARTLILAGYSNRYAIFNPVSRDCDLLPPVLHPRTWHRPLALIQHSPSDYTVIVVRPTDSITTQTYDSRSGRWEQRGHILLRTRSINLETAVWHQGLLYCVSRNPDHFLTFDLVSGEWMVLDVDLPMSVSSCHLLSFGGDLYLTASTRHEIPSQIGIWKLDQSAMIWREFDFKPSELTIGGWFVVDCVGMICFCGYYSNKILMCDLVERKWWWSQSSTVPSYASPWEWVGLAIEPPINLLK